VKYGASIIYLGTSPSETASYKMIDLGSAIRVNQSGLGDEASTHTGKSTKSSPGNEGFPG
jgi:hypothetical protein